MKNKRGTGLIITGFVLILAAAGLFGYNVIEERKAENSSEKADDQRKIQENDPGIFKDVIPVYTV